MTSNSENNLSLERVSKNFEEKERASQKAATAAKEAQIYIPNGIFLA